MAAARAGSGGAGAASEAAGAAGAGAGKPSAAAGGRAGSGNAADASGAGSGTESGGSTQAGGSATQGGAPPTAGGTSACGASGSSCAGGVSAAAGGVSAAAAGAAGSVPGTGFIIDSMPCAVAVGDWCQDLETGTSGSANFVALTSEGDVILAGYQESTALTQLRDVVVARYKPDGTLVWVVRIGSEYDDYAEGVTIDAQDDVFVVGDSSDPKGTDATGGAFIAKLSPAGELIWSRTPGAPDYYRAAAVAVDAAGNPVLLKQTGYVLKYSPSGDELWTTHVDAGMGGVAVDATGNVFVVGAGTTQSGTLTRLSPSGAVVWTKPLGTGDSAAYHMALDRNSDLVILAGGSLARYSAAGDAIWSMATGKEFFTGDNLALDGNGNVFVVGMADDFGKIGYDTYVARFGSDGIRSWGEELGLRIGSTSRAIAASATGQVFITGPYAVPGQSASGEMLIRVTP